MENKNCFIIGVKNAKRFVKRGTNSVNFSLKIRMQAIFSSKTTIKQTFLSLKILNQNLRNPEFSKKVWLATEVHKFAKCAAKCANIFCLLPDVVNYYKKNTFSVVCSVCNMCDFRGNN